MSSEVYPIGTFYDLMPIPPIDAHCVSLDAGPLRFVVEARQLTEELARAGSTEIAAGVDHVNATFDDFGASLHVYGADDGLEHIRFDCFANEPHYHYLQHAAGGMVICRLDDIAEGDPIAWTVRRLRERLPEMLEFSKVPELARTVRSNLAVFEPAIMRVEALLREADALAAAQHHAG
jgi:hypothetical protein